MQGPQYSSSALLAFLTLGTTGTGMLVGCKIGLYEDEGPISPDADIATLTPASYGGYAPSAAVVWKTPHVNPDGVAVVQCVPAEFKPTDNSATATVRVVVLESGAGDAIVASYRLDEPLIMGNPNDVHMIGFPVQVGQLSEAVENIFP